MSKPSGNKVKIESWNVRDTVNRFNVGGRRTVTKVAVRGPDGRFHGATNFRGSVVR